MYTDDLRGPDTDPRCLVAKAEQVELERHGEAAGRGATNGDGAVEEDSAGHVGDAFDGVEVKFNEAVAKGAFDPRRHIGVCVQAHAAGGQDLERLRHRREREANVLDTAIGFECEAKSDGALRDGDRTSGLRGLCGGADSEHAQGCQRCEDRHSPATLPDHHVDRCRSGVG